MTDSTTPTQWNKNIFLLTSLSFLKSPLHATIVISSLRFVLVFYLDSTLVQINNTRFFSHFL